MKSAPLCLLFAITMLPAPAPAQTSPSDSQTLKDILTEIRAIHADVRLSQTTQILLTELQLEQSTVNTALQHRDSARNDLAQTQMRNKQIAAEIARLDDPDADPILDPARKKQMADQITSMKTQLVISRQREVQQTNDLQEAEAQLAGEQSKLAQIQSQLDDQIKRLQPPPNPPAVNP